MWKGAQDTKKRTTTETTIKSSCYLIIVILKLTEHVDDLSPAVIHRSNSLVVQSPHRGPPDVAPARPPDHHDHVGVEEHQQAHRNQKEDDEGEFVNWIILEKIILEWLTGRDE